MADAPVAGLGLDGHSLDTLRQQASRDPRAAAHGAAVQFESVFTQMMLKSMRDATPTSDGQAAGDFTSMLDQQFARQLAGRPRGLAEMIEQQLTRHMPAANATQSTQATQATQLPQSTAQQANAATAATATATATAASTVSTASPHSSGSRAADFIKKMLPHAQEAERRTGVPACYILGQAGLESGWGRCEIRNSDGSASHNLFGIKASSSWKGAKTSAATTEYAGGVAQRQNESFRSYSSYADAFSDYAKLLTTRPRYHQVLAQSATPETFATGMQRAGYATDPAYASKLARSINQALAVQRATGQA